MIVRKCLFVLFLSVLSVPAMTDVYRYVDENGNVVFSDEPPRDVESEVVELEPYAPSSTPTPVGIVRRDNQEGDELEHVDDEYIEQLARQQVEDHDRRCLEARVALEVLHQGMPVYRVGDGEYRAAWTGDTFEGPRVYLNDTKRQDAIDGQIRKLAMNCKDPLSTEQQQKASTDWMDDERCRAARAHQAEILRPDSRATDEAIEDRQRVVDQYCQDQDPE